MYLKKDLTELRADLVGVNASEYIEVADDVDINKIKKIEGDKVIFFTEAEILQMKIDEEIKDIKKQIENAATMLIRERLNENDYDNEGEVALYASNTKSTWYKEASELRRWIEDVYQKMYELQDSINVDNYKNFDLSKVEEELRGV